MPLGALVALDPKRSTVDGWVKRLKVKAKYGVFAYHSFPTINSLPIDIHC